MRARALHSRWTRRYRVRRAIARFSRAGRQRRVPTLGPMGRAVPAAGCGDSGPAARVGSTGGRRGVAAASYLTFVEFPPLLLVGPTSLARTACPSDLERAGDTRLRYPLLGFSVADGAALGHGFWGAGR